MEVDPLLAAYAGAVVLAAYTVRGVAGFGSALIAVPLLALRFPLALVVPLVVALDYVGSASQGLRAREHIAWAELVPLIPATLVGVALALAAFHGIEGQVLRRVLGVFVITFAVYQVLPLPQWRASRVLALPFGLLGGLFGTLFGSGGPMYMTYLSARGIGKSALRASFATFFVMEGTVRLAGFAAIGLFDWHSALALVVALPVAAVGLFVGGRVHLGLSALAYKRIISVVLLGSGLMLLLSD